MVLGEPEEQVAAAQGSPQEEHPTTTE